MDVGTTTWLVTVAVLLAVIVADLFIVGPEPARALDARGDQLGRALRELGRDLRDRCRLRVGHPLCRRVFAGWLTEYSLSIDNLFVFVIIMSRFAVPRRYQQTVLLVGIVLALIFRGLFIAAGAAVISSFSWIFYLFGAFLIWTAVGPGSAWQRRRAITGRT